MGTGWRGLGLFWALVIAVTGSAAAFLQVLGPLEDHRAVPSGSTAATRPAQAAGRAQPRPPESTANATKVQPKTPAPNHFVAATPAPSNPPSSGPSSTQQSADDPPNSSPTMTAPLVVNPMRPKAIETPLSQKETGPPTAPLTAQSPAVVSDPETTQPVLSIYYSFGSRQAENNARSLVAQIGSNVASVVRTDQTDLPKVAVIRVSEERNHSFALAIGRSLAKLGYPWRIENASSAAGARLNVIEVWLPGNRPPRPERPRN